MCRYNLLRIILVLGALLFLIPVTAHAKFIIEFADGHRMTVSNYEETEREVKVYTSLGSFAFRREDVVQIIDTNPGKKAKSVEPLPEPGSSSVQGGEEQAARPQGEEAKAKTEKRPDLAQVKEALGNSAEVQDFVTQVEDGLFRMRYVFALIIGLKAVKLFFAASVR